jgi:hypothetical protein
VLTSDGEEIFYLMSQFNFFLALSLFVCAAAAFFWLHKDANERKRQREEILKVWSYLIHFICSHLFFLCVFFNVWKTGKMRGEWVVKREQKNEWKKSASVQWLSEWWWSRGELFINERSLSNPAGVDKRRLMKWTWRREKKRSNFILPESQNNKLRRKKSQVNNNNKKAMGLAMPHAAMVVSLF